MKKIIAAAAALIALGCTSFFAKEAKAAEETTYPANLFIAEATAGIPGFGVNEVFTYDHMFNNNFGIGGGVNVSEGLVGTVEGFVDFKIKKWNLGIGGGYNYAESTPSYLMRGVYHGNSWDWGAVKAGMTLGADWHLYTIEGNGMGGIVKIVGLIPRFVVGINCQFGK